jgi:uncharacterized surface protein with fasciclin (FAS1) repeats
VSVTNDSPTLAVDVIEAARASGRFADFIAAADAAGLSETLKGKGPFTLFAPTDDAFAKLASDSMTELMSEKNKSVLRAVISFHFAVGQVSAARFAGTTIRAKSFEGGELLIRGQDGLVVNGARVILPDIEAQNGVIHGVNRVLWPKSKQSEQAAMGMA